MRSNGTDFYCLDNNSNAVFQYSLSTANDISTATYASKTISVASQETTPTGLAFSSDGTKMFVCGQVGDDVNQYTLSTAWDVSTASFDSKVFSFKEETTNPAGIDLKPDDTKLYMISNSGDAVYQYDLTATNQPKLLLNFQDAGIYDRSGINNLDTVGDAQIDTAVTKYGTGSLQFDGTGDYLEIDSDNAKYFQINNEDFTAEFWANGTANGVQVFCGSGTINNTSATNWWIETVSGVMKIYIASGGSFTIVSDTVAFSTYSGWVHVAFVNSNGTSALYMNGTRKATATTPSTNTATCPFWVGGTSSGYVFDGYIDDLRISKGIARYTGSSFTPPTAAHGKF